MIDNAWLKAFKCLKEKLILAPIIMLPICTFHLRLCVMLVAASRCIARPKEREDLTSIYYASKVHNLSQENYTMTEQESHDMVLVFEKF